MKTEHITNRRLVGGDYFRLMYARKSNKTLQSHLDKFNPDDYWIVKTTRKQRLVTYEELLEFKYGGYTFFKKDLYDIDKILEWVDWFNNNVGGVMYLSKPTPPFSPNKIIIKQ